MIQNEPKRAKIGETTMDPWHDQLDEGQAVIEVDSYDCKHKDEWYKRWQRTVVTVGAMISIGRQYLRNWPGIDDADGRWHYWQDEGISFGRDALPLLIEATRIPLPDDHDDSEPFF